MKLMVVTENIDIKKLLASSLQPLGIELIHYLNPIKAMDNIEEVEPDIVFFNAEDFPRHWKPFISLLRDRFSREQTPLVLIHNESFGLQEAAKAAHLGVATIIPENPNPDLFIETVTNTLTRLKGLEDQRIIRRYVPKEYDEMSFIITHPVRFNLIPGKIRNISAQGISFLPDDPPATGDIEEGTDLKICSLKTGSRTFSPVCRVIRNQQTLVLQFVDPDETFTAALSDYIQDSPRRGIADRGRSQSVPAAEEEAG